MLTGTIFHGTKVSIRTWVMVFFEMCLSKNGVAAREVERKYGVCSRTAWHMMHRIREAMKADALAQTMTGTILADETWIGGDAKNRHANRPLPAPVPVQPGDRAGHFRSDKTPVLSLINKETGEVRSRVVPNVTGASLLKVINEHVNVPASDLHTDDSTSYNQIGPLFRTHQTVNHSHKEYVRGNVTTNHLEGYFSQLKRSIDGTHHHVSVEHLPRYLAEFDFRYSTRKMSDAARMSVLAGRVAGKRLTYQRITS